MRTEIRLVNQDCPVLASVYKAEFKLVLFYGDKKIMRVEEAVQVLATDGPAALKLAESLLRKRYSNTRVEEYDHFMPLSPVSTHKISKIDISLASFNEIASGVATGATSQPAPATE